MCSDLYGPLAATSKGQSSDKAAILGLLGHEPDTVAVDAIPELLELARSRRQSIAEMMTKSKKTACGGLAVNIVEC